MYMGASLNVHFADLEAGSAGLIPDLILGYGIASRVWIELSGSYGEMKNYTESGGYIVYNGLDWMNYKLIGNIIVPLGRKGTSLYAGARFAEYRNTPISFDPALDPGQNQLIYNSLSIFGGLSWKF
jgi:hypothetical protein